MQKVSIKRGVDLPFSGAVGNGSITDSSSSEYALLADDFKYLKPKMTVKEGDRISAGTTLLLDKGNREFPHISPVNGVVEKIARGEKRAFQYMLIRRTDDNSFIFPKVDIPSSSREQIAENLIKSGLWTSFISRPFGNVPAAADVPSAIFVTAMDTRPLAPSIEAVLKGREQFFEAGVKVLSGLTDGKVWVCVAPNSSVKEMEEDNIFTAVFSGPHPAGLAGTHMHFLHPVSRYRSAWEISCQDVANIGELFLTGNVNRKRVIALTGDGVNMPQLLRVDVGSSVYDITKGRLKDDPYRLISGSSLYGSEISTECRWLGRYSNQVTTVEEGAPSKLFSWFTFGFHLFSLKRIFMSHIIKPKKYHFDTSMRGSVRSMVPVGSYEQVMPLDIVITPFLRYLTVGDTARAEEMGALELLEEDLSLCTYASPGKVDFEPHLRHVLDQIRKEI